MSDPIRLRTATNPTETTPLFNPLEKTHDAAADLDLCLPRIIADPTAEPGRVDPQWALAVASCVHRQKKSGLFGPMTGGITLLAGGWTLISLVEFIADAFARSAVIGGAALAVLGTGIGVIAWGIYRAIKGVRSLDHVDDLRAALDDHDRRPLHHVRTAVKSWLQHLPDFPRLLVSEVSEKVDAAADRVQLRSLIAQEILPMLDRQCDAAIDRASRDIITLAAITPSGLLDAGVFLWRASRLVGEIAGYHGLRPGLAGSWLILRRIFADASLVAAAEMGGNLAAQAALSNPILKHLAGDAAAAGIAGWRMARLGAAASGTCRLLVK